MPAPDPQGEIDTPTSPSAEVASLAPSEAARDAARTELASLLEAAGIQRVIQVDDEFDPGVDELLEAMLELPPDERRQVSHMGGLNLGVRTWQRAARRRWNELSPNEQAVCVSDAMARSGRQATNQQPNAGALGGIMPMTVQFRALGLEAWRDEATTILETAAETPTVILFDRHFGDQEHLGVQLIREALQTGPDIRAGLLTNTVTRAQEFDEWRSLRDAESLPGDRFIVISKLNLAGDTLSMPQAMKVSLLSHSLSQLVSALDGVVDTATDRARYEVRHLSPYEFERMVFGSSMQEGLWEPDTLLRIFNVYFQGAARQGLRRRAGVNAVVREARQVAAVEVRDHSETTSTAAAIQRLELYDDIDFVNAVLLPIELGDVFRKTQGKAEFVLVDQPCDLMVRKAGRREPDLDFVEVLAIKDEPPKLDQAAGFELDLYEPDGTKKWVHLNRPERVPVEALDLCALNANGKSTIPLIGEAPSELSGAWANRFVQLQAWARDAVGKIEASPPELKADITQVRLKFFATCIARGKIEGSGRKKAVGYNLKRTARLQPPATFALLTAYHAYKARQAFEGPLAPRPSKDSPTRPSA